MRSRRPIPNLLLVCVLALLLLACACNRGTRIGTGQVAYVSIPQLNLRDRLSVVYNTVGTVKIGERVEILEKSRHFARVRSPRGEEGWIEARYLTSPEVFDSLNKLAADNINTPVEAQGIARTELKMHLTPGRDTDALFRVEDGAKVEMLKRATAEKPQGPLVPQKTGDQEPPKPVLEDWWLVRDAQHHVGWVLARMVDVDIPLDIARYAEGQRIIAAFVLDQVPDVDPENGQTRQVPQFLTLVNDPKDGTPWDYNQIRVFTWNSKRHRYETAYREHNLFGVFPVTVGHEVFDKEGDLPTFTIRVKDDSGAIIPVMYKLNQPIVRRVLSPEEQQKLDQEKAARILALKQARESRRHR